MKTDAVIKHEGISALISKLGYVDAERFIVLINREPVIFPVTSGMTEKWLSSTANANMG